MNNEMLRSAMYGALVADASGMGLHWIYSQGKIASVVKKNGDVAEFLEPDEDNYKGVPSFFAHGMRSAGDGSNYSEYIYVLLQSIEDDTFSKGAYIRNFSSHFGTGGTYVGYADGPMRETMYNISRISQEIKDRVEKTKSALTAEKQGMAAHYISRYFFEHDLEGLKSAVSASLKLNEFSKDELREVEGLIDSLADMVGSIGPDDDQMPALSRSALFPVLYSGDELDHNLELAVRLTNNNDDAVAYSKFMAHIVEDFYAKGSSPGGSAARELLRSSAERHLNYLGPKSRELVEDALGLDQLDYRNAAKKYGAACHVNMAIPLSMHILLNTESFKQANRINIMASGDNCGRSLFIGSLAGIMYGTGGDEGIPEDWIAKTRMIHKVHSLGVI